MREVTVRVPATTANIGPGFDCLGAALTLYNQFKFTLAEKTTIEVIGDESTGLSLSADNLLYQSFLKLYQQIEQSPPLVKIEIEINVPLARGLGSSATAIVGGLVAANHLAGDPLTQPQIRDLAISIEGHPDNVVPALLGNCQLSVSSQASHWQISQIPWHSEIIPVLAIPDFQLSTEKARSVLPLEVSRQDAIFNMAHLGLLLRALETGNQDWLRTGLQDRLHQPYRQSLITGYHNVSLAALEAGSYGLVISGAGPTLLALSSPSFAVNVALAMQDAWQQEGINTKTLILSLDSQGAKIQL